MVNDCPGWNHCPARPRRPEASSPSARSKVWTAAAILSCWLAAAAVSCLGPARIGFLSDDFDSLARAVRAWLLPDRAHHYSPVIAALFKLTAQGTLARRRGTCWRFGPRRKHPAGVADLRPWLGDRPALRLAGDDALLAGRPGYEAIAWAAGLGYVLVESTLLAAVCLRWSPVGRGDGAAPLGHAAAATGRPGNLGLGGLAAADRRGLLVVSILPSGNRGNMSPSPFGRGSG